jgi:hypothetical protein
MQPTSLEQVIAEALEDGRARLHVSMPARVVSYDEDTQTASVQPILRSRRVDQEGTSSSHQLPSIPKVPVAFPQGGGCSITFPLAAGDEVLLVVAERSMDEWKQAGGGDISPKDPRRFDLSDAVALAGLSSPSTPLTQVLAGAMVLAANDLRLGNKTATDFVALASLVLDRLTKLQTAFDAHMHATAAAGAPSPPTPVPGMIPVGALVSVAATKVRAI